MEKAKEKNKQVRPAGVEPSLDSATGAKTHRKKTTHYVQRLCDSLGLAAWVFAPGSWGEACDAHELPALTIFDVFACEQTTVTTTNHTLP